MLSLIDDCLYTILSFLTPVERYCLRRTCRELYARIQGERTFSTYTEEACFTNLSLVKYFAYHPSLITYNCFKNALQAGRVDSFLFLKRFATLPLWEYVKKSNVYQYAALSGRVDLMKLVFSRYQICKEKVVRYAIRSGNLSLVSHLIQEHYPRNVKKEFSEAVTYGSVRMMNWLRKTERVPISSRYYGYISDRCCRNCDKHVENLVTYLEKMYCPKDKTSLYYAAKHGYYKVFLYLLKEVKANEGIFRAALEGGNERIVATLLQQGFRPRKQHLRICSTYPALQLLLPYENVKLEKLLLNALEKKNFALFAELSRVVPLSKEVLYYAVTAQPVHVLQLLHEQGYRFDKTCLKLACLHGQLKLVQFLVKEHGCQLHNSLHYYAGKGQHWFVHEYLIENGYPFTRTDYEEICNKPLKVKFTKNIYLERSEQYKKRVLAHIYRENACMWFLGCLCMFLLHLFS